MRRSLTLFAAVASVMAVTVPAVAGPPYAARQTFVIHVPTALQRRTLVVWCFLPAGQHHLPAGAEYGLASHLRQYPDLSLATPEQRAAAEAVRRPEDCASNFVRQVGRQGDAHLTVVGSTVTVAPLRRGVVPRL